MKVGDRVIVNDNVNKYGSHRLAGRFGYVERINLQWTDSYGIKIDGKFNDSSKDGLFWLDAAWLTILINSDTTSTQAPSSNPTIKTAYCRDPYTIIIWSDKTKTVVKCGENDIYDPEKGLAMAAAKRFLGTNKNRSNYYDQIDKWLPKEVEMSDFEKIMKDFNDSLSKGIRWCSLDNLADKFSRVNAISPEDCKSVLYTAHSDPVGKFGVPGLKFIGFSTNNEAEVFLNELKETLKMYGIVLMSDLYNQAFMECEPFHRNYGWTNLGKAYIRPFGNVYQLVMPAINWEKGKETTNDQTTD